MSARIFFGALCAAALSTGAAQAQEFLKHGDVISGQVRVVNARQPNGMASQAYQIVSDAPKAFAHRDNFCKTALPKTFHLVETDNKAKAIRLKRSVGKKVDIVADEFMCSHTAAHTGDAVVTKWRFTGPEPR